MAGPGGTPTFRGATGAGWWPRVAALGEKPVSAHPGVGDAEPVPMASVLELAKPGGPRRGPMHFGSERRGHDVSAAATAARRARSPVGRVDPVPDGTVRGG